MSNFTDFIGGGGGGGPLPFYILHSSQTWTPPHNGTAMIHVIGAGGSGGVGFAQSYTAGGGYGGGYSRKTVTLSTSSPQAVTIGAGGSSVIRTSSGSTNGISGGTSSGFGMTVTGGSGQNVTNSGGSGSGGDVNRTGGAGSDGGGGAVGINGTGEAAPAFNSFYRGGNSDILSLSGELFTSEGYLACGGLGGRGQFFGMQTSSSASGLSPRGDNGGFLAGGGCGGSYYAPYAKIMGGHGGIGGGGGGAAILGSSTGTPALPISGAGGDGLILIKYLTLS